MNWSGLGKLSSSVVLGLLLPGTFSSSWLPRARSHGAFQGSESEAFPTVQGLKVKEKEVVVVKQG